MLSTQDFDFNPNTKTLTADCSDLPGQELSLSKSFPVKSHHTGRVMWFQFSKNIRDAEGDLVASEFKPVKGAGVDIRMVVWND